MHQMEILKDQTSFARADSERPAWWLGMDGLTEQVFSKGAEWKTIAPLANLNHEVALHPLSIDGVTNEQQTFFRPVRSFTGGRTDGMRQAFGRPFSGEYENVQVAEMVEMAKAIETVVPGAHIATAGAVRRGNRAFITVRVDRVVVNVNGHEDETVLYVSILNSWDGSSPFAVSNGATRTECDNTFSINLSAVMAAAGMGKAKGSFVSGKAVRLVHRGTNMADRIEAARLAVTEELGWGEAYKAYASRLAQQRMTDKQFEEMVKTLVPVDTDNPKSVASSDRKIIALMNEWNREVTTRGGKTAWGALNAFTYLTTHHSVLKGTELDVGVKLESRIFRDTRGADQGEALATKAADYLRNRVLVTA